MLNVKVEVEQSREKRFYILLGKAQAVPGRAIKQEQEEISLNHEKTLIAHSVRERQQS